MLLGKVYTTILILINIDSKEKVYIYYFNRVGFLYFRDKGINSFNR